MTVAGVTVSYGEVDAFERSGPVTSEWLGHLSEGEPRWRPAPVLRLEAAATTGHSQPATAYLDSFARFRLPQT